MSSKQQRAKKKERNVKVIIEKTRKKRFAWTRHTHTHVDWPEIFWETNESGVEIKRKEKEDFYINKIDSS